jgi:hypothetical protein
MKVVRNIVEGVSFSYFMMAHFVRAVGMALRMSPTIKRGKESLNSPNQGSSE